MPIYTFCCDEHGDQDVFQNMNDKHVAFCNICNKKMKRIYYPSHIKCGNNVSMGKTRMELFDNLASEGFAHNDWRENDSYYKSAKGITD